MGRRALDGVNQSLLPPVIDSAPPGGPLDASLHVDADAICPRCLAWIDPHDFVRRNAYGLLQHETCRVSRVPAPAH